MLSKISTLIEENKVQNGWSVPTPYHAIIIIYSFLYSVHVAPLSEYHCYSRRTCDMQGGFLGIHNQAEKHDKNTVYMYNIQYKFIQKVLK